MDNSYVMGYINYGLILFGILMIGYFILSFYLTHRQKTRELVILVCFLAAGWTEQLLFNTSFKNITLLFLGELLYGRKNEEREYGLLPSARREIDVPLPSFVLLFARMPKRLAEIWKSCQKRIFAGILAGGIVGAVLCGVLYRAPEGYVVPRVYTDGLFENWEYLESADDPAYDGYRIMNYVDADTRMQIIEENSVKVETARYYVGSMLIGGFAGYLACILWSLRTEGRKRGAED